MTDQHAIEITPGGGGWLVLCTCGSETFHPRRPVADRAAHDHKRKHEPRKTKEN